MEKEKKERVIWSLTAASSILWAYSLSFASLDIGFFGLVHSLDLAFFAALYLLLAAFVLSIEWDLPERCMFFQVILLITFIYTTPVILEGMPRFRSTYLVHGFAEYVTRTGSVDPVSIWYHNWPGASILLSMAEQLTGLSNGTILLKYFPAFIQVLYLFPLYLILDTLNLEKRRIWLGVFIFYLVNYINQEYVSPQAIGFLYYLAILAFILRATGIGRDPGIANNSRNRFVMAIIFIALVISHMLSSIIVFLMLLIASALATLSKRRTVYDMGFLFLVLISAWTVYGASTYLDWHLADFVSKAFHLNIFFKKNIGERVSGSASHVLLSRSMLYTTILIGLLSVTGIIASYRNKPKSRLLEFDRINVKLAVLTIAVIVSAPMQVYGGEMLMRAYLFSLPFIAFYASQAYTGRFKYLLLAFLVLMTPAHMFLHYGNEEYDYVSPAEIAYIGRYPQNLTLEYVTGGYPMLGYKMVEDRWKVDFDELEYMNGTFMPLEEKDVPLLDDRHYIIISRGDAIELERFRSDNTTIPEFMNKIQNNTNYIKLYTNNDVSIFRLSRDDKSIVH